MGIFEFALKMELDGEKYYRNLAAKAKFEDLKRVLESLAEDEQRHYEIIQLVQNQTLNNVEVSPTLDETKNIFKMSKNKVFVPGNKDSIAKLKEEQLDLYQAALVKEKESVGLYKKIRDNAENHEEKVICEKLMREEEKHVEVLDNIIELLNHVNDWVESAEFNHIEDRY